MSYTHAPVHHNKTQIGNAQHYGAAWPATCTCASK